SPERAADVKPFVLKEHIIPKCGIARPKVVIPVFPGTNCEYDTAAAFERAGAQTETIIIKNLTPAGLSDSINALAKSIESSQMIMLPGGFSAGDEPEGSGKFIAAVFRNPLIAEKTMQLLKERDGLMLGICNGFQALIKLGLLPYGEIREIETTSPTLTYNRIGRHVSTMVHTKITSELSPWLWETSVGEMHTIPVSHGEGRFVANEAWLKKLSQNGQICAQYVDLSGEPTMDIRYNPNGSDWAIEAICSPDGRVLGKMGHSERLSDGCYKNIPGEKEQGIFAAGVRYFK
ncbi:MAG: phosphoribosylformylglycinamidine synthase subunit PurQ, partial [Firmicutes bacterium]|nr:phosphoribosylformylglycinamidine synthase subunit PurQ [Bacillota bacterium]